MELPGMAWELHGARSGPGLPESPMFCRPGPYTGLGTLPQPSLGTPHPRDYPPPPQLAPAETSTLSTFCQNGDYWIINLPSGNRAAGVMVLCRPPAATLTHHPGYALRSTPTYTG